MQTITVQDARNNLADIINQVALKGKAFVITKFGSPKAMVIPIAKTKGDKDNAIDATFGAWSHRKDIKDTGKWVSQLRTKMSIRKE